MSAFRPIGNCLATVAGVVTLCVWCGGCGGGGFGESVSVPRQQQTVVDSGFSPGKSLVLPQGAAFNVADAQRHSSGTGKAESFAKEDGVAGCAASVSGAGEAWAEFQVGHVVFNEGQEAVSAAVLFDCEYEYTISGPQAASPVAAAVALKLFIQDSNKTILRKEMLVDRSGKQGADRRSGRGSPSFNITMKPGLAYHLVLAGRVSLTGSDGALPVEAKIDVKKLTVEIQARK